VATRAHDVGAETIRDYPARTCRLAARRGDSSSRSGPSRRQPMRRSRVRGSGRHAELTAGVITAASPPAFSSHGADEHASGPRK
jgi:hypothetical protein